MIKVQPIIPASLKMFLPARHKQAIERTLKLGEEAARAEIQNLTRGWSSSPRVEVRRRGDLIGIVVADARWNYNDEGTRPHTILPKRRKMLKFEVGGVEVFARKVRHPGTKPQYLTRAVQRRVDALNLAQTFTNLVGGIR